MLLPEKIIFRPMIISGKDGRYWICVIMCIEILEKHESRNDAGDERQALCAIADTLDRLAGLR